MASDLPIELPQTLLDLQKQLLSDTSTENKSLKDESARNAYVYARWVVYMSDIKDKMIAADMRRKLVIKERMLFYTGRSSDQISDFVYNTASELRIVLAGDKEVIKAEAAFEKYETMYNFALKAIDAIKGRGFDLKASIEMTMFEHGAK